MSRVDLVPNSVAFALILCVAALAPSLPGQINTGRISGSVTDATGAIVANAAVRATNEDTGVVTRSLSSESGEFLVNFLVPGMYRVEVEKPGFQRYVETGVSTTAGGIA